MSMSKFVIATVGTSLIEKLGKERIDGKKNKLYDQNIFDKVPKYCNINNTDTADSHYKDKQSDVKKAIEKLQLLNSLTDHIFAPAEIASMWKLKLDKEKDKVSLLYSDTCEGVFCSVVLQEYLRNRVASSCDRKIIKGLQSKSAKEFKDKGLKSLAEEVTKLIKANQADKEIILNLTGGYKGIVPYLTLMGICNETIKIVYLYEESDDIIDIPLLPFNLDYTLWNDNRAFIKTLPHIKGIYKEIDQLPLTEKLKGLFEIDDGKINITVYHDILEGSYIKAKQEKALSEFGRGYVLADMVVDKSKQDKLKKWINNSQNIWYGDNIPETVDHSRGHCQRLLELAAQIIGPINQKLEGVTFLTDDELIVLTLTLWFHDIGHSGRKLINKFSDEIINKLLTTRNSTYEYVDISEFPTANRDLHHILGFIEALKEIENFGFHDTNTKPEKRKDWFLDVEYLKAAIYAYLYHRKKMLGLPQKAYTFKFDVSITKEIDEERTLNGGKIRLRLLAALQTFIDECDNSRERAGDAEFKQRRIRQTEKEIETEYEKLIKLYQYANGKSLTKDIGEINSVMQLFMNHEKGGFYSYGQLLEESKNFDLKIQIDGEEVEDLLNDCIEKYIDISSDPLKYEIATTLNKVVFKLIQNWHFDKSNAYNSVFILPAEGFEKENYIFDVYIESNENVFDISSAETPPQKDMNGYTIKYPTEKRKNEGVIDICKQYKIVKGILSDASISFKYIRWVNVNKKDDERSRQTDGETAMLIDEILKVVDRKQ